MAPNRRKIPAPTDYTTDEEDMITYDVEEDELEQHPHPVQKDGFNECLALCGRNRLLPDGPHNHLLIHPHQILIAFFT
ncbi:hypothetical protein TNCV_4736051 [Trichonephila clavipes]|nr:hypothetical protein TNCV_4736051 [Trichonephila clavipes]